MNDADLIRHWLNNGHSPATVRTYTNFLRHWENYARESPCGSWRERTLGELQGFADYLRRLEYKNLQEACDAIRSLVNFGTRMGYILGDPAREWKVQTERHVKVKMTYLTEEQIRGIIEGEEIMQRRLFLTFMFTTGCRISEAVGIRWEDITRNQRGRCRIDVRGKGARHRTVALGVDWTVIFDTLRAQGQERPFPFTRQWGYELVKKAAARIGVKLSPHQLRHAHITARLKAGEDAARIATTVGNSLQVILAYYDLDPNENISEKLPEWADAPISYRVQKPARLEVVEPQRLDALEIAER